MSFSQKKAVTFYSKRLIVVFLSVALFIILYSTLPSRHIDKLQQFSATIREGASSQSPFAKNPTNISPIANGTLGFGAIMALGLPDRLDNRDALELSAAFTQLKLTWVDGVRGDAMNPKAIPPAHTDPQSDSLKKDDQIGSWRGHMDIMRRIVKEKLSTALIFEDDVDWDIHIVEQMHKFAEASKEVLSRVEALSDRETTGSPYGEGWDILWIGHCGGRPALHHEFPRTIITNDSTVPPSWDMEDMLRDTESKNCSAHAGRDPKGMTCDQPRLAETARIVQYKTKPKCMTSYAVSYHGAQKLLARMGGVSLTDADKPVDDEMGDMCQEVGSEKGTPKSEIGRCLSISPPLISKHRPRGLVIGPGWTGGRTPTREVGITKGIVWSTRLNVENLLGQFEPESQYVRKDDGTFRYRSADEYREAIVIESPFY